MARLRLRPLLPSDEPAVVQAHAQMESEGFVFAIGRRADASWAEHLVDVEAHRWGHRLPDGWVPTTFLVAEVEGTIVGRTSIRHELNDFLLREGGHIGYGVLEAHRRMGHATEILRQSLIVARSLGMNRVLVTCDEDNVGSAKVIERCGGALESTVPTSRGIAKRRYWID